jgi:hypothetical protein
MSTDIRPELSEKNTYWISKHRYYELSHFCMQYNEWIRCYASLDGASIVSRSIVEKRKDSDMADPTAKYAEAKLYFRERLDMVTHTAEEAAGDLSNYMILAVTQGYSYSKLMPPCCKEVWYTMYRRFFWLLDKARK